jgi:hypothetical protein
MSKKEPRCSEVPGTRRGGQPDPGVPRRMASQRSGPSSGLGRCGASDGEIPIATREIQRRNSQEEGCPSVDAVCEAHDARGGREAATGNTRDPEEAEVAVLPWVDQPVQAGPRGR